MALKFKFTNKDEIPAEHSALYVARDGAFFLDVEGAIDKSKLEEFRTNNIALQKKIQEMEKTFEGLDVEKARELLKKQGELDDANLFKAGDIDKIVEKRLSSFRTEIDAAKAEKATLEARLADVQINQAALAAATKRGIRSTAVHDLMQRARGTFRIVNGQVLALDADGKTPRYSADGVTPLTFDEWTTQLVVDAPHLFESSAGGGAAGNGSGGAGSGNQGKNPWKKETWNLTEQGKTLKANPTLAAQLKVAAGR